MMSTAFTELFGVEQPIMLAPMGDVAGGRLAAAVSAAGGLGMIGGGYGDRRWIAREFDVAGSAQVGIGFITFALDESPQVLTEALEFAPLAVQLSFGDPAPYVEQIHAAGALVIAQTQTVGDAVAAAAVGVDLIVAQGQDSGGHGRSGRGTVSLVPATVDVVAPIPVLAAGGIADGRGLAAAMCLGAAGVAIGTRLYATDEAISDHGAYLALVERSGDDTVRTAALDQIRGPAWPEGFDGRALLNSITGIDPAHLEPAELEALSDRYRDAAEGDYEIKALWVGEGLDQIHDIRPAGEIVRMISADADAILAGRGAN